MILIPMTFLAIAFVNLSFVGEARAQSRYCLALVEEAEAFKAQWLMETSATLKPNEAILGTEYEFSPIMRIQMISSPIPANRELCQRANTQLSKKAASLCYCRGGHSYRYQPFDTIDTCEVRMDETTGMVYAYMEALVICM